MLSSINWITEWLIAVFYEVFLNKDITDIRFVESQRSEET
jgi:hypothetical protein